MTACNKTISFKSRSGESITPTLAYRCEIQLGEDGSPHDGPCANPSDIRSRDRRIHWEAENARKQQVVRHAQSGLGLTQSIPLPSASVLDVTAGDIADPSLRVGRRHPSEPVKCPFCSEEPLSKHLSSHIQTDHAYLSPEEAVPFPVPEPLPPKAETFQDAGQHFRHAVPMPPSSIMKTESSPEDQGDWLDWAIIDVWVKRNVNSIPAAVREALAHVSPKST